MEAGFPGRGPQQSSSPASKGILNMTQYNTTHPKDQGAGVQVEWRQPTALTCPAPSLAGQGRSARHISPLITTEKARGPNTISCQMFEHPMIRLRLSVQPDLSKDGHGGSEGVCLGQGRAPLHASQPGASSLVACAHADSGLPAPLRQTAYSQALLPRFVSLDPEQTLVFFKCVPPSPPAPPHHTHPYWQRVQGRTPRTDTRPLPHPSCEVSQQPASGHSPSTSPGGCPSTPQALL